MSEFSAWVLANHPRVVKLKKPRQCCEMKGGAPVKAYWKRDGSRQDDPAILAKWTCKVPAYWKFTALKRSRFSKSGVRCWKHLYYRAIFGDENEMAATEKLMVSTGYARPDQTITQTKGTR